MEFQSSLALNRTLSYSNLHSVTVLNDDVTLDSHDVTTSATKQFKVSLTPRPKPEFSGLSDISGSSYDVRASDDRGRPHSDSAVERNTAGFRYWADDMDVTSDDRNVSDSSGSSCADLVSVSHQVYDMRDDQGDWSATNSNGRAESGGSSEDDLWGVDDMFSLSDALNDLLMSDDSEQEVVLFNRTTQTPAPRQKNKHKPPGRPTVAHNIEHDVTCSTGVTEEIARQNKRKIEVPEARIEATGSCMKRRKFDLPPLSNI